MEQWYLYKKKADFTKIGEKFQIDPVIARLIRNRDVIGDEEIHKYLYGNLSDISDPFLMKGVREGVDIIREKIRDRKTIRIISDYDVDGVVSNYILWKAIYDLGGMIDFQIPDRMKDGYGINENIIEKAVEDQIDTILTCDNGIAASEAIRFGKEHGLTMIITDHHDVPFILNEDGSKEEILPPADVVINPKQKECKYPYPLLCGAGVAFQFVRALYKSMGEDENKLEDLLSMLAIATVCDVVDLTGENRIFVRTGLEMLKKTKNEGLKALFECTGIDVENLNTYHIGFVIGPCINACGRLDTAKRALELLNAPGRREAVMMAEDLKALNESRKEMTEKGVERAVEMIETSALKEDRVLVVYLPDCHESIAGIIAGRLKERYYRPTFVLTKTENGAKGSGRSIEAYDMFAEMNRCAELFTRFGGHKLAAGLSLPEEKIGLFRKKINELAQLTEEDMQERVSIDLCLPFEYIDENLVAELKKLEPFGMGNEKPKFAERNLSVIDPRIFGKNRNVLKCRLRNERGMQMDGIYFGDVEDCLKVMEQRKVMPLTFYPKINEYMGKRSIQLEIVNYQ